MLKVYDKVTYRFGEIIDAETTEQGESWILVRWNGSPLVSRLDRRHR